MACEAVKIKTAQLSKNNQDIEVLVLTFNIDGMDYHLLNEDLKQKYFEGQTRVKIQHFTDFIKAFLEEHENILSVEQKYCMSILLSDCHCWGDSCDEKYFADVNLQNMNDHKTEIRVGMSSNAAPINCKRSNIGNILITISEVLNNVKKTYVIMLDETYLNQYEKGGKYLDASNLAKYKNIHFVMCLRP